jgi:hypothetical protein
MHSIFRGKNVKKWGFGGLKLLKIMPFPAFGHEGGRRSFYSVGLFGTPKGSHEWNMNRICDGGFISPAWDPPGALTDSLLRYRLKPCPFINFFFNT